MEKKLFEEIKELLNDLGDVNFLGNDYVPNYIEIIYKTNKETIFERLKQENFQFTIIRESDKEQLLHVLIYGIKSPLGKWVKKTKSWYEKE